MQLNRLALDNVADAEYGVVPMAVQRQATVPWAPTSH